MTKEIDYRAMLGVAVEEARTGLSEGGIPIGAALFDKNGNVLGRGHNRRVQENDPSVHGKTDAFRKAGRQRGYRDKTMVATLAPCWYCSGLIRQFGIGRVIVGESVNFAGALDWLRESGVEVVDLASPECIEMLGRWIAERADSAPFKTACPNSFVSIRCFSGTPSEKPVKQRAARRPR